MEWLVDTGCNLTLLSESAYHEIPIAKRPILEPYLYPISLANGAPLRVIGRAYFELEVGGRMV